MNLTVTNGMQSLEKGINSRLKHPLSMPERKNEQVCESGQSKSMRFSGSFTGKSEAAASVMKKHLFRSEKFNNILDYVDSHNIITSSLVALIFAGILRPLTILSLPGKRDKEDKIYASGHSLASALMGFAFSLAITTPLDQAVKKMFDKGAVGSKRIDELNDKIGTLQEKLYRQTLTEFKNDGEISAEQYENISKKLTSKLKENLDDVKARKSAPKPVDDILEGIFEEESISSKFHALKDKFKQLGKTEKYSGEAKELKNLINTKAALKTIVKNLPDWIIAIPRAALTVALIPPILKYVFGIEKGKSNKKEAVSLPNAPEKVKEETVQTKNKESIDMEEEMIFNRPAFEDFNKGGNR